MSKKIERIVSTYRPRGIKPGLARIKKLLSLLGDPHKSLKYIHLAGTNGKGTTACLISQILKVNGLKTGLYLSPHIKSYRERFLINDRKISNKRLIKIAKQISKSAGQVAKLTEFEFLTALAFYLFNLEKCQIVVLETGLGGRWDATNIVSTVLASIITNIDYDHQDYLGKNLSAIYFEKLAIAKNHCPLFLGEVKKDLAKKTLKRLGLIPQPLIFLTRYKQDTNFIFAKRIALAVCAYLGFKQLPKKFLSLPGRWETISTEPQIIYDIAHNPGAVKRLLQEIKLKFPNKKIHYLLGLLSRKDGKSIAKLLPSAFQVIKIKGQDNFDFSDNKKATRNHGDFKKALSWIKKSAKKNEVFVIFGSSYLRN